MKFSRDNRNISSSGGNRQHTSDTGQPAHSQNVQVNRVILDRLVYILPWGKESHHSMRQFQLKELKKRLDSLENDEVCEPAFVRKSRYRFNIRVPLSDRHNAFVQIGALNPDKQKGDIRVELNPARLRDGEARYFHNFMCKLLGKDTYRELWGRALVNVLHPAVDVHGVELNDLLVHYSNARRRSAFVKRTTKTGDIEGYNFGSMSSDYVGAVYDKRTERVHRAVEAIARTGRLGNTKLKEAKISQFYDAKAKTPYIRVELRGKKMRGVPVNSVAALTNRFKRFSFVDLKSNETASLPRLVREACISRFRDKGRDCALDLFKGTKHFNAVESWLSGEKSPSWWQPEGLWRQAVSKLKASGLFPDFAFDDHGMPDAASEKQGKSLVTFRPINRR